MLRELNTANNKNFKKVPGINRCESKKKSECYISLFRSQMWF